MNNITTIAKVSCTKCGNKLKATYICFNCNIKQRLFCMCEECLSSIATDGTIHLSDCMVHNEPAFPKGICNCKKYFISKSEFGEIYYLVLFIQREWAKKEILIEFHNKIKEIYDISLDNIDGHPDFQKLS